MGIRHTRDFAYQALSLEKLWLARLVRCPQLQMELCLFPISNSCKGLYIIGCATFTAKKAASCRRAQCFKAGAGGNSKPKRIMQK